MAGLYDGNKAFGLVDGAIYHLMLRLLVCGLRCCYYCVFCLLYLHFDGDISSKTWSNRTAIQDATDSRLSLHQSVPQDTQLHAHHIQDKLISHHFAPIF